MKKVLLISQSQDGSYINVLARALDINGFSLTVFSGKLSDDIQKGVEKITSVKYDSTSFRGRLKTWHRFVKDADRYLKEYIDKFEIVMFTSNPPINQSLVKYAHKRDKKCVYLVWDIYPDCIEASFGKKVKPITSIWRKKNEEIYSKCDAVLTIGEVMKDVLLKSYPNLNVQVIDALTDDRQHITIRGRRYTAPPLTSKCSVVCQSYIKIISERNYIR